jgi:hypothetical protein
VSRVPVRLCNETRATSAEPAAQGADGSATTTAGGNELSRSDFAKGPDIGPDLYALAQMCDAEFAKLRALQQWIRNDVR